MSEFAEAWAAYGDVFDYIVASAQPNLSGVISNTSLQDVALDTPYGPFRFVHFHRRADFGIVDLRNGPGSVVVKPQLEIDLTVKPQQERGLTAALRFEQMRFKAGVDLFDALRGSLKPVEFGVSVGESGFQFDRPGRTVLYTGKLGTEDEHTPEAKIVAEVINAAGEPLKELGMLAIDQLFTD